MSREKHTFTSKEIAHVWANEGATHGKSPGAMRFEGPAFYSYATVIARIVKHKGKTAYVIDGASFSPSTRQHQSAVRHAIPDQGAARFIVDCGARGQSLNFTPASLRDWYLSERVKLLAAPASKYEHKRAEVVVQRDVLLDSAREVCRFFGLPTKRLDKMAESEVGEVIAARTICNDYANRRANARNKREATQRANRLVKFNALAERILNGPASNVDALPYDWKSLAESTPGLTEKLTAKFDELNAATIADWRAGKIAYARLVSDTSTMLRRVGDIVETSKGARVPLADAQRTFDFVVRKRLDVTRARLCEWNANGETHSVGMYALNKVNGFGIVAGCHRITWEEIERFAVSQQWLKFVRHIPQAWQLVQNRQDIHATLESIGKLDWLDDCGCLFAEVGEGEYLHVYGCERSVPVLDAGVFDLIGGC